MYAITTTPGFIIESRPSGEAGKLLSVFTRDLGLVLATAQGIRLEKSKLRYHTQDYSFGEFSFVRGKEFWKLTSASALEEGSRHELIARIAALLKRLLHGEEAHPELFSEIYAAADFLKKSAGLASDELLTFESVLVFRIMRLLGYIGADKGIAPEIVSGPFSAELIMPGSALRATLNKHINKAFRESHL